MNKNRNHPYWNGDYLYGALLMQVLDAANHLGSRATRPTIARRLKLPPAIVDTAINHLVENRYLVGAEAITLSEAAHALMRGYSNHVRLQLRDHGSEEAIRVMADSLMPQCDAA